MRKITGLLAITLIVSAMAWSDDAKQAEGKKSATGGTVNAKTDTSSVVTIIGDEGGTKVNPDGSITSDNVNVVNFNFQIQRPVYTPPPPVVKPQPPPPPPVAFGNIMVTSDYAGVITLNGEPIGPKIKAGGAMNIVNVVAGAAEIILKDNDGKIVQTPQKVVVQQGQTVNVAFKAPPPPPPPVAPEPEPPEPTPPPPAPIKPAVQPIRPVPDTFVLIKGGVFTMGSPVSERGRFTDEEPQHDVTISDFYICMHQLIQGDFEYIMGRNPSQFKGYNLPVEKVSWFEAIEYCNKRSIKEDRTPAYTIDGTSVKWNRSANGYRLPTEAEWEYACRAGTTGPFSTGQNITTRQANYNGNYPYSESASAEYRETTTPVGNFPPNQRGVFDMHGNVWEWCWDWYGVYSRIEQTDPAGPPTGINRVNRGGSWYNYIRTVRSANRENNHPSVKNNNIGFRLALNAQ